VKYLEKFSDSYFQQNKAEEWFQDRYNPLNVLERERENTEWAAEESEYLKKLVLEKPITSIRGMRLGPLTAPAPARPVEGNTSDTDAQAEAGAGAIEKEKEEEEESVPSLRTLEGHEDCCVFVSRIPAGVTKSGFSLDLVDFLATAKEAADQEKANQLKESPQLDLDQIDGEAKNTGEPTR